MSKSQSSISFKIDEEKKEYINQVLEGFQYARKIENKGDALFDLIKEFSDQILNAPKGASKKDTDALNSLYNLKCDFRIMRDFNYLCAEKLHKTKTLNTLGDDISIVSKMCESCLRGKDVERQKEYEKEMRKDAMRKLLDFRKEFIRITKEGFNANCYMCSHDLSDKFSILFSNDGYTLLCPINDYQKVDITSVCEKTINPINNKFPCQYLIALAYTMDIRRTKEYETLKQIALEDRIIEEKLPIKVLSEIRGDQN